MGAAENKELVRSFYEAGNRGGPGACFLPVADDVVTYGQVIRIQDGKFADVTEYMDTALAASIFG